MRLVSKGVRYEINWAKAQNIKGINCPDLKVGAIENQAASGLLPQASLRGAQNNKLLDGTLSFCSKIVKSKK
jgi:hypothetical protein